jgi:protein-disulfide isomerase
MKNKILIISSSLVVLGLLFWLSSFLYKKEETKRLSFVAQQDFAVFVRDYSPKKGNENPQVHLVEFFDPECESCREFYPIVKQLLNEFEGKVQLVLRYAPFHPNSTFAVKMLEAARKQGKYWETLEVMLQYQPQWGSHHHPRPELLWKYIELVGLDLEKLKVDMESPEILKNLAQDVEDARTLNVRGTPTFFVNGKPLQGFGPDFLRNAIEQELK